MAEYESRTPAEESPLEIVFVLVEPRRQENIGAAARALKTMGFGSLWLVDPPPLTRQAYWVAHESDEVLDRARTFASLTEVLTEVDFSIATGARRRLERDEYLSPAACRAILQDKPATVRKAAVVFGRESSGLTGEEMAMCDAASRIPLAHAQPSLNLGQAVMLYAWELSPVRDLHLSPPPPTPSATTFRTARRELEQTLSALNVGPEDNLRRRAREFLTHCDDRDLGLLLLLMRRIGSRGRPDDSH